MLYQGLVFTSSTVSIFEKKKKKEESVNIKRD